MLLLTECHLMNTRAVIRQHVRSVAGCCGMCAGGVISQETRLDSAAAASTRTRPNSLPCRLPQLVQDYTLCICRRGASKSTHRFYFPAAHRPGINYLTLQQPMPQTRQA